MINAQHDQKTIELLRNMGLSDKEATVYLCLLEKSVGTASSISSHTKIKRSTVFFVCGELLKKNCITKEQTASVTKFYPVEPVKLLDILDGQERKIQNMKKDLQDMLPFLNSMKSEYSIIPKVQQFEGIEGIYKMIDDQIKNDVQLSFISNHDLYPKLEKYIEEKYIPKRKKMKSKCQMIVHDSEGLEDYLKKADGVYNQVIKINDNIIPFNLSMCIYDNKVSFVSYSKEDMSGVIIQNKHIYKSMKSMFDYIANSLT